MLSMSRFFFDVQHLAWDETDASSVDWLGHEESGRRLAAVDWTDDFFPFEFLNMSMCHIEY